MPYAHCQTCFRSQFDCLCDVQYCARCWTARVKDENDLCPECVSELVSYYTPEEED